MWPASIVSYSITPSAIDQQFEGVWLLEPADAASGTFFGSSPALRDNKRLAMESPFGGMAVDDPAYARLVKMHSAKRQTEEAAEVVLPRSPKSAGRSGARASDSVRRHASGGCRQCF
jgi:hypothetical protein